LEFCSGIHPVIGIIFDIFRLKLLILMEYNFGTTIANSYSDINGTCINQRDIQDDVSGAGSQAERLKVRAERQGRQRSEAISGRPVTGHYQEFSRWSRGGSYGFYIISRTYPRHAPEKPEYRS
jgi:hypothetical protein